MARVAGIQIEKDNKGRVAYVRINIKKHPEFIPQLEQLGAISEDEFEKMWSKGISVDQLRESVYKHIDELFDKNGR